MRTTPAFLMSFFCFTILRPSSSKLTEHNSLKDSCECTARAVPPDFPQGNGASRISFRDRKNIANIEAELTMFSGNLRSYVKERNFDHGEFLMNIDAHEKTLAKLFDKAKWFFDHEKVSSHFWFTKHMFLAMKDLTDYLRIFNRDMQPINELLYKLFEFEIHVYRIIDDQGNLDLSIDKYIGKLLEFYLHLRDLKRTFEQTKSPDHLASWLFTSKVRKLDEDIQKLWLQVPKKKSPDSK